MTLAEKKQLIQNTTQGVTRSKWNHFAITHHYSSPFNGLAN